MAGKILLILFFQSYALLTAEQDFQKSRYMICYMIHFLEYKQNTFFTRA